MIHSNTRQSIHIPRALNTKICINRFGYEQGTMTYFISRAHTRSASNIYNVGKKRRKNWEKEKKIEWTKKADMNKVEEMAAGESCNSQGYILAYSRVNRKNVC